MFAPFPNQPVFVLMQRLLEELALDLAGNLHRQRLFPLPAAAAGGSVVEKQ
jgi:hypothetical protein